MRSRGSNLILKIKVKLEKRKQMKRILSKINKIKLNNLTLKKNHQKSLEFIDKKKLNE